MWGENPGKVLFVGRSCGVGQIPELLLRYKLILGFHATFKGKEELNTLHPSISLP